MASTKWYVKQGDSGGYITEQLLDENLEPVDLTLIEELAFEMQMPGSETVAVADTVNTEVYGDPEDGTVRYQWQSGDLDTYGQYFFEWRVLFSTGQVQTFPSSGYNYIEVIKQLNN